MDKSVEISAFPLAGTTVSSELKSASKYENCRCEGAIDLSRREDVRIEVISSRHWTSACWNTAFGRQFLDEKGGLFECFGGYCGRCGRADRGRHCSCFLWRWFAGGCGRGHAICLRGRDCILTTRGLGDSHC